MIFHVIPYLILNKTHLITGSEKIISSENLTEKLAIFGKKHNFWISHFLYKHL